MIHFKVQGEPRGKGRPRASKQGAFIRVYTDDKTASYENLIKLSYIEAKQEKYLNKEPLKAYVKIYQGIPKSASKKQKSKMLNGEIRPTKKPDIDNVLKCVFDGLNAVAFSDDTQIIETTARKFYSESPHVEIFIYTLEEAKNYTFFELLEDAQGGLYNG